MQIETTRFGTIDIEESQLFQFPMGLLGFSGLKRYVVLDHSEDSPLKWLQSVDDGSLAFIITDPLFFVPGYRVSARRSELEVIKADEDQLVLSVIMTVPENPQDMSANLMAPLIFNMKNRSAMQYVLTKQKFPVKYYVLKDSPSMIEFTLLDSSEKAISLR
jgi:flagellar assembly factor FliW